MLALLAVFWLLAHAGSHAEQGSSKEETGPTAPAIKPQWRPYSEGPLTALDFAGMVPAESAADASTYTSLTYNYRYRRYGTSGKYELIAEGITVTASVGRHLSWNRQLGNAQLLDHEQGHFDITELSARLARERYQAMRDQGLLRGAGRNLLAARQALEAIVAEELKTIEKQWELEQRRYDSETQRGNDTAMQAQWRKELDERLRASK